MTPRSPDAERLPALSRRALVLGSLGVLAAAVVMATLGFTAGPAVPTAPGHRVAAPTPAASSPAAPAHGRPAHGASTPGGATSQLTTLSLSEVRGHKPLP